MDDKFFVQLWQNLDMEKIYRVVMLNAKFALLRPYLVYDKFNELDCFYFITCLRDFKIEKELIMELLRLSYHFGYGD